MKALELTVRHKFQDRAGEDWYVWGDTAVRPCIADMYGEAKRLTDAELAAEMHAANSDSWRAYSAIGSTLPPLEDRFETLYRFATLPHYDEPQP